MFGFNILQYISVEPTYFLFFTATEMIEFLSSNLYLQKVCRPPAFSEPDLNTPCADEKRGEEFVTEIFNNMSMVTGWISTLVCLLLVSYSDSIGRKRKIFVTVSMNGVWLQSVSEMMQSYFWHWPPLPGVLIGAFLPDLFGGWFTVMVFCVLLIYEKSSSENRHLAITGIVCVETLAKLTGRAAVGHLLRSVGFFYSFAVCFSLLTLAQVCVFAFVREEKPETTIEGGLNVQRLFKNTYESWKAILFPKRSARHRAALWLLQTLTSLVYFNLVGEQSVFYLYFRYRYHWDEGTFSNYSAYRTVIGITGSVLCTLTMSKFLKIHDGIIGTIAAFMDTIASVGYFFAVEEWQIYAAPLLDILHGVALATCYSLASKFFTEEDFGKLNAVHALFSLAVGLSLPMYSFLFRKTMDTLPNAFFLLSAFFNFLICIIYGITYFLSHDIR